MTSDRGDYCPVQQQVRYWLDGSLILRDVDKVIAFTSQADVDQPPVKAQSPPSNLLFCLDISALLHDGIEARPAYRSNTPAYLPGHNFVHLLSHLSLHFTRIFEELKASHWVAYGAAEWAHIDPSNPAQSCRKLAGLKVYEHLTQLASLITIDNGEGFFRAWNFSHANFISGESMKLGLLPVVTLYIQRYETALQMVSSCEWINTRC
jgi:hypothetical protein